MFRNTFLYVFIAAILIGPSGCATSKKHSNT